ncbi:MAG: hypothetical protein ACRDBG_26670 [Waterburya sp.]
MTLKTPIVEVKWGDIQYKQEQIRDLSISLGKDGKSNSCTITFPNYVDIPSRGSQIEILIYYVGSPYEFAASFSHVGTTYGVGNEQYLEIKGGSLLWSSANQSPQNKQYFSGDNSLTINVKDFLIKFVKDKFKKDTIWQAKDNTQTFVYASQNGETDLQFFERILKSYKLEYKEDNNKIIILDKNQVVDRSYELGSSLGAAISSDAASSQVNVPRVHYIDVGTVRDIIREFQPASETAAATSATTDSPTAANSGNNPVSSPSNNVFGSGVSGGALKPDVFKLNPAFANSCAQKTIEGKPMAEFVKTLPDIKRDNGKKWGSIFSGASWKNDPCLIYYAIHDVSKQLSCDPVNLAAIGCFESEWKPQRAPNQLGCVGVFQCCPSGFWCTYSSQSQVLSVGAVGQIYGIGFLLTRTIGYDKVPKPIPLLNLYAGVLAGGYFRTNNKDGNNTKATATFSDPRFKKCISSAEKYVGQPSSEVFSEAVNGVLQGLPNSGGSATSSITGSGGSETGTATTNSTDTLPFKCRFTVDMTPRFTGMKSGDLVVIPSDKYTGTEDFVVESVNYTKNGSSFDLQVTAGRPIDPKRIAQDEIYEFVKNINTQEKYYQYLWGS